MENREMFCNPVFFSDGKRHTNPDPYILRFCGKYYCYATDEFGVKVSVSENLTEWTFIGYAIKEEDYRNYWAPSVIYINGIFYMYYSNVQIGIEDCHEECLKLAVSDKPEGPFKWKKTFFEKFSIDSHPIIWNEKMYMFYSVNDWIGTEEKIAGTCILVDEMVNPEEFAGNPQEVVLPSIEQEIYEKNRFGDGRDWYTIEGAAPIRRGSYFWMLYSANAYVNEDYFVGTAVAKCRENMMDMRFEKYPSNEIWHPLLKKNEMVEGTGHNTVEKAPDMMDDWIIYHGRKAEEKILPDIEQREMYIDPLYFNGREIICFGPTTKEQEKPGRPDIQLRDIMITREYQLAKSSNFYLAEFWLSAKNSHTGMSYAILLDYRNEKNYLKLAVHSGKNEIKIIHCVDGIQVCILSKKLKKGFDYTVPHRIQVEKRFTEYSLQIDEMSKIVFEGHYTLYGDESTVGIMSDFTTLRLHSFALTRGMILEKKNLHFINQIYDINVAKADETGLRAVQEELVLERKFLFSDFKEEFLFEALKEDNYVKLYWEDSELVLEQKNGLYSICYVQHADRAWMLVDGKKMEFSGTEKGGKLKICLKNNKIIEYRLKKENKNAKK